MKLPFEKLSIDKSHVVAALLGAATTILLFAGFTTLILSIMPILVGVAILGGLFVWFNKPTVEDKDDD